MHAAINALCIDNLSGTGRYAHGLIDGFAALSPDDARFSVFIPAHFPLPRAWRSAKRFRFYSIPVSSPLSRIAFEQWRLPALLKRCRVDLIHSPAFVAPIDAPRSIRQLTTVHDLAYIYYPQTIPALRLAYYRWAIPRSIQTADLVITDSEAVAQQVRERFSFTRSVNALRLGVDPVRFRADEDSTDAEIRRRYGIKQPYLLFVGTREPRKNLDMLLTAYARARSKTHCLPLVIAGRVGWKLDQEMLKKEGVIAPGFVAEADLPAFYRGAAALLAPSLDEGFNLPAAEARACAAPVLASDIAVHRELLGDDAQFIQTQNMNEWAQAIASHKRREASPPRQTRTWTDVARDALNLYRAAFDAQSF